jgi:hypothetical protein
VRDRQASRDRSRKRTKRYTVNLRQITQPGHLQLVKNVDSTTTSSRGKIRTALTPREQYVAQRARGAYVASSCQPEASFDLSLAAQSIEVLPGDITTLNKRLQWQIDNHIRGLKYVTLDLAKLQLVVFTDSSFANNRDLSSQIGHVICLAESDSNRANIVH